jgi:LacI family transcriptional regulator
LKTPDNGITIKDIARLSGVGIGTVSRVLNGGVHVRDETREKVLKVIRKYNFIPNKAARTLKRGDYSVSTIGIVFPAVIHPFYYEILKGIYDGLGELNYNLLIYNIGQDRDLMYEHIADEGLAGVIIVATPITAKAKELFNVNNTSYLFVDYKDDEQHSIFMDNRNGGVMAASYLAQKAKTIAYIGDNFTSQQQDERYEGFTSELKRLGIDLAAERFTPVYGSETAEETIKLVEAGIDGFFYFCDHQAYGGLQALTEMKNNGSLKEQVKLVGFDDMEPSQYLGLTTIRQPAHKLGYEAARLIIDIREKHRSHVIQQAIMPELIIRDT